MTRLVFRAESTRARASRGTVVRGSTTSVLMPSGDSISAARSATCTMLLVATIVTSRPSRFTSATPKGIAYSPSGTGPFSGYINLSSKMTTGLSSRIAVFQSPLASKGVDGRATFSPGTWLTQACRLWLCCAAERRVAPRVVRTTIGTFNLPPDM